MAPGTDVVALDAAKIVKPKEHSWSVYIRNGLGLNLSRLGEHLGIDSWTYNAVVLELFHSIALKNATKVAGAIRELFPTVKSAIDVGCGSGALAAELSRAGVSTIGLEHSRHGVNLARKQGVDCRPFNVRQPISEQLIEKADLIYSFEVAEHVPAALADRFISFMTALGPLVIFAAAQPGQGGIGHINEQPLSYWITRFAIAGFRFCREESDQLRLEFRRRETSDWFYNNSCVFRRSLSL